MTKTIKVRMISVALIAAFSAAGIGAGFAQSAPQSELGAMGSPKNAGGSTTSDQPVTPVMPMPGTETPAAKANMQMGAMGGPKNAGGSTTSDQPVIPNTDNMATGAIATTGPANAGGSTTSDQPVIEGQPK